jgi:hypothetical protein
MVVEFTFHVTFNNISAISCGSVLLVKETGVPEENHQPTLSHNVALSGFKLTTLVVIGTDRIGS